MLDWSGRVISHRLMTSRAPADCSTKIHSCVISRRTSRMTWRPGRRMCTRTMSTETAHFCRDGLLSLITNTVYHKTCSMIQGPLTIISDSLCVLSLRQIWPLCHLSCIRESRSPIWQQQFSPRPIFLSDWSAITSVSWSSSEKVFCHLKPPQGHSKRCSIVNSNCPPYETQRCFVCF